MKKFRLLKGDNIRIILIMIFLTLIPQFLSAYGQYIKPEKEVYDNFIKHPIVSPNGEYVANMHSPIIWSTKSGEVVYSTQDKSDYATFSLDSKFFMYAYDSQYIVIVDIKDKKILDRIPTNRHYGETPKFNPSDSSIIAYTESNRKGKFYIVLKNIISKNTIASLEFDTHIRDMNFNEQGTQLFAWIGGEFYFIDGKSGKILHRIKNKKFFKNTAFKYILDDSLKYIAIIRNNGASLTVYNMQSGNALSYFKDIKNVYNITFSDDSSLIAYSTKKNYILREIKTGKVLFELNNNHIYKPPYQEVCFDFKGDLFISNFKPNKKQDEHIGIWSIKKGLLLNTFMDYHNGCSFSKDGSVFILNTSKVISICSTNPYNENLAKEIYDKIDKSDYIALYAFTRKFTDKLDVVQQAYRDIYNAVTKKDTLSAYEWYVIKFKKSVVNERYLDGYHLYQKNFDKDSSKELDAIYSKYEELEQKKYAEIFEDVDDEDNLVVYSWFAERFTSLKANDMEEAIEKMHQIAFDEAEDIDTLSAYNTFILAYPYAKQVEEANKRAYELEEDKYTDIGFFGFFDKSDKMNRQARKLLLDMDEILLEAAKHNEFADYENVGHFLIVQRMLDLALKEFGDTDAILTLKESNKLRNIKRIIDQKINGRNHNINQIKTDNIEDAMKFRSTLADNVMNDSIADAKMREFYLSQHQDAKEFIDEKNKELEDVYNQEEQFIQERLKIFEELYQSVIAKYQLSKRSIVESELNFFTDANNKWGFKDESGAVVIPPKYDAAGIFFKDSDLVEVELDGKWGYINRKGIEVIPLKYDFVIPFLKNDGGLASVKLNGKWGYINKKGEEIIPLKYDSGWGFSDNGLSAQKLNGKWGYINKKDEAIIAFKYDHARPFAENGLAAVSLNGKHGYINAKDEIVIPFKYEDADGFYKNKIAKVKQNNKYGYINAKDEVVIPIKYDDILKFTDDGIALAKFDGKWGFINKKGVEVIPPKYDDANNFAENGLARVKLNGEWFSIDAKGEKSDENASKNKIDANNTVSFNDNGIHISLSYPKKVHAGDMITLDASMTNESKNAIQGGLSLSFPHTKNINSKIIKHNFTSLDGYSEGDGIYSIVEEKNIPAKYFMIEGWQKTQWSYGDTKSFNIKLSIPLDAKELIIDARGILWITNSKDTKKVPDESLDKDQQGFAVKRFLIDIEPKDHN